MEVPKYRSLKDHVYDYIAQKIQDGTLLPNQKINEAEICKKLDISRTPTREALFQLASDNLLQYIPRRGFIVTPFDAGKKLEFSQAIGALEALAATLAVDLLKTSELLEMETLIARMDEAINQLDLAAYNKDQYQFHNLYIQRCGNATVIEMLNTLKNSFIRQSYVSDNKSKLSSVLHEVNEEHRQILSAFRAKDKLQLEALLKHHWRIIDNDML
ncbi:GntR family transcriptional regulator [Paenibacillus sp. DCT19]|uniref:GntR family transcriptional regulator n=1 Tax=Paenibacillus sp. DCT19 TaxID=2211212 RepID=UPI000FE1AE56|nr:GntR family transcriptional regulator [Paenibacillus sp. DCT19]